MPIFLIAEQLSVYYQRRIYRNWNAAIGYNAWNETGFLNLIKGIHGVFTEEPIDKVGALTARYSYKMVDVIAFYKFNKFRKHKINLGLGPSFAFGVNEYIDSVSLQGYEGIIYTHGEHRQYFGVMPTLGYDYLCFKKKVSIGLDFRYRHYFGLKHDQGEYGFHVGYNFL